MTPNKLARELCTRRGLKSAKHIREMLGILEHLSDLMHELDQVAMCDLVIQLQNLGEKRETRRAAKKESKLNGQ